MMMVLVKVDTVSLYAFNKHQVVDVHRLKTYAGPSITIKISSNRPQEIRSKLISAFSKHERTVLFPHTSRSTHRHRHRQMHYWARFVLCLLTFSLAFPDIMFTVSCRGPGEPSYTFCIARRNMNLLNDDEH